MRKTRVLAMTIAIMMFASLLAGCANKTGDETDTGVYNNSNIAHLADDKNDVTEGTTSAVTTSETTTQTTTKETEETTTEPTVTEPAETQESKEETTKAPEKKAEKKTVAAKNNANNVSTNKVQTAQQTTAKPATTTATTQATTAESTNVTTTEPTTSTTSETSAATTTEATTSTATETTTEATTTTEVTTSTEATTTTEVTTEVTTPEETTTTEPIKTTTIIDPRTYDWGDGYWGISEKEGMKKKDLIEYTSSGLDAINMSFLFCKADIKPESGIIFNDTDIVLASRFTPTLYIVGADKVTFYKSLSATTQVGTFNFESSNEVFVPCRFYNYSDTEAKMINMDISAFDTFYNCSTVVGGAASEEAISDYVNANSSSHSELNYALRFAYFYDSDSERTCGITTEDSYDKYFTDCEYRNKIISCPNDTECVYGENITSYAEYYAGTKYSENTSGAFIEAVTIANETDENGTVHHILRPAEKDATTSSALEESVNIDETKDLASEEEPKEPVSTDDKPVAESPEAKDDESNSDKEEDNVDKKFEDTSELEEVVDSTTTD